MGPDDWHVSVNNSVSFNVMVSLAIHWARYFACLCNRNEGTEVPNEWIQIATYLELPFDNVARVHYQHEGYEQGIVIRLKKKTRLLSTQKAYLIQWVHYKD